jgi:hypothetical protein
MDVWTRVVGVGLLLYAFFCIYRGRISVSDEYTSKTEYLTRADKPILFWLLIAVMLGLGLVLALNVFNF